MSEQTKESMVRGARGRQSFKKKANAAERLKKDVCKGVLVDEFCFT